MQYGLNSAVTSDIQERRFELKTDAEGPYWISEDTSPHSFREDYKGDNNDIYFRDIQERRFELETDAECPYWIPEDTSPSS
jgi:hypothetical protein